MMQQVQTRDSYDYYIEKNNTKVSYKAYRDILETLNFKITEEIIKGNQFDIPFKLGHIICVRANRTFKLDKNGKPIMMVDYKTTSKLRKEGKLEPKKFVYYTSPEYCFIKWDPKGMNVSGCKAYVFKPSRTNNTECSSGFVNRFYKFINENETNCLNYPTLTSLIKSKK